MRNFSYIYIFFYRQKLVLRDTKKRGAPNIYRQYTPKTNPSTKKERKSLEKSKVSCNKEPPKNSDGRKFPNPKTVGTTPQGIGERDPSAFGLTILHLQMSFGCAFPKYTKINKLEPAAKLLFSSSLVPGISILGEDFSLKPWTPKPNQKLLTVMSKAVLFYHNESKYDQLTLHYLYKDYIY